MSNSKVTCKICDNEYTVRGMNGHILSHGMNPSEYKEKYGNYSKVNACKNCGIPIVERRIYCSNECKFSDEEYNKRRGHDIDNDDYEAKCVLCDNVYDDPNNLSGYLGIHLKNTHGIEFSELTKDEILDYYDIVEKEDEETLKCPICEEWETKDLENNSGALNKHVKNKHKMNIFEFIDEYPSFEYLFELKVKEKNYKEFLNDDEDNYIMCEECGKKMKKLTNTHLQKHGLTPSEYKQKYGIASTNSETTKDIQRKVLNELMNVSGSNSHWVSNGENDLFKFLNDKFDGRVIQSDQSILNGYNVDIHIPDKNTIVEYNGLYWHSEFHGNKDRNYHLQKTLDAENVDYRMIHVFEDEYEEKCNIVKSVLMSKLGLIENTLYARDCSIEEIDTKLKNKFLNENHLQGSDASKYKLGLFYKNDLVSVMTIRKPNVSMGYKNIDDNCWEISRLATKRFYNVVGGASKLLSYFIDNYRPNLIYTYVDRRWTSKIGSNVYNIMGFDFVKETKPNYFYMSRHDKRLHRFNFTKSRIVEKMDGDPDLSEWENMKLMGYDRIWDCGHLKYVWNK